MEKRAATVIIIGAGIEGCSTAYQLAKRGMRDVIVLEKEEIAYGGSGRNAGGVRQSARDVRELPLSMYAINNQWPHLSEELDTDVEYVQKGNLRLGQNEAHYKILDKLTQASVKAGLDVRMINGDEAREICPSMSHAVTCASWCPTDGHANPLKTTLGFYRKALSMGVTFITGVSVCGIRKQHGRARQVLTDDGIYEGEHIVLTAGFESRAIANTVDIDIPMRRNTTECLITEMEPHMFDVMLGTAEADFYGHQTKHGSFLMGGFCGIEPFVSEKTRFVNTSMTASCVCRGIIKYFPLLRDCKIIRTWSGMTDKTADGIPVISNVEEVPGLTIAAGLSGHGFAIGPSVGLAVSELVLDGRSHTIDISPLRYDRFKAKA